MAGEANVDDRICDVCGGKGHIGRMCPSRGRVSSSGVVYGNNRGGRYGDRGGRQINNRSLYEEFILKYRRNGGKKRLQRLEKQKLATIDRMVKEGKALLEQSKRQKNELDRASDLATQILTIGQVNGPLWIWSTIGGHPTKLVVDTGAKASVINLDLIKEWSLENNISKDSIVSLVGASGDHLKVRGTIRLPVKALNQKCWISKEIDEEGTQEDKPVVLEPYGQERVRESTRVRRKEWRDCEWDEGVAVKYRDELFVEFVVVDDLSVDALVGMEALARARTSINCEEQYVSFCGQRVDFGWVERESKNRVLVVEETRLRGGKA